MPSNWLYRLQYQFYNFNLLAEQLKRISPETIIVLGGPTATTHSELSWVNIHLLMCASEMKAKRFFSGSLLNYLITF